ncbi:MAG TPA: pre-peptidase C-terminal domain-containing protein [Gammaproteobacteria bacterium]|nr:pre-peptidase C-terminal domain-containing protein [Gammaproteobacteria bacterium]
MTALSTRHGIAGAALAVCLVFATAPLHGQPDFGDNTSQWANDGECDDPRFEGAGSADTLLDEDRGHDATDCRTLFTAGRITLRSAAASNNGNVNFGNDSSRWARDGECDDPRFEGEGSADTLLDEDNGHDAADCRSLFQAGRIALRGAASSVDFGDDSSEWARDGECDDPRFEGDGSAETLLEADAYHDATDCRTLLSQNRISLRGDAAATDLNRGRLEKGDDTLSSGEYMDAYTFTGSTGQRAVVDLRSGDFDPYVFVRAPSGKQFDNDDFEGDANRSLLALDLTESGEYKVTVTTYKKDETGGYTLSIDVGSSSSIASRIDRNGRLENGDVTLTSGEFVDTYEFEGSPGQHVAIDLRSSAFDTYLILRDPAGEQTENDDATESTDVGHSSIEADLTEAGTYKVLVTSYETGQSGAYSLTIDPAAQPRGAPATRDVTTLTVGRTVSGDLGSSDPTYEAGEYHDTYVFDGDEGETVRIELTSTDFDTYLGLITPSGEEIANDDFEGDSARSVIALTLSEAGRYRVQATSYGAAETGRYGLELTTSTASIPIERRSQGRVYGLFTGISDYPGSESDLNYTAEDATRIRDALVRGGGMRAEDAVTLVDGDVTVGNMTAAIRDIGRRMQPQDTFVMFYSGHGGQVRRSAPTSTDPDGLDETLALYDGALLDDDLASLFDEIHNGTVLLWLDSCFSGGFAKDIVSAPGRMGIFSSEEDITSNVASKFRAGGYLSAFLDEAIAQGLADDDKDSSITAIELSQYLHERYRADVKSARPVEVVRTEMTLGYQHLVVDRGSIGAYDVLFER